jgi:hypothetical protein
LRRFGERRDGRGEKLRECSIGPVKRLLALLAGAFGLRALLRRSRPAPSYGPSPAEELRTRLAESRNAQPAAAEPPPPPSPVTEPSVDEADVEQRRADVHNRARGAIDELKS